MKKYKQLYKYSDCVITNLHIIQHTRWTFFLYSYRYNASHQMEDKKRLLLFSFLNSFFFSSVFFLYYYFFLHSTHPQWNQLVDEVRSFRCTVGSWTGCMVSGSMSCFDGILQGHNHDLIVLDTWTRAGPKPATGCTVRLSGTPAAANTVLLLQLAECTPMLM